MNKVIVTSLLFLSVASVTNIELVSRLGGLAHYDTDAGLTWLAAGL
jgi:hypothetical protein